MLEINVKGTDMDSHFVIMCDEAGIFDAFNFLKDQLAGRGTAFLSLIYTVSDKNLQSLI